MASKKSEKQNPKCRQHPKVPEPKDKQPKPDAAAEQPPPVPATPDAEDFAGITALDDGAPSPGVEFCENCGQSIDINSAEAIICPECGGLGSDECCMDRGEDEPCKLCRQEMEDEIPDKEDKEEDEEHEEEDDDDEDEDDEETDDFEDEDEENNGGYTYR